LQEVVASYEQRLRQADEAREREVAALRARAEQAFREQREQHQQDLDRLAKEFDQERRLAQSDRKKVAELQVVIDQLRAERQQRKDFGGDEDEEEVGQLLDDAKAEARKFRIEVDVLMQRLQLREKLYKEEKQRMEVSEMERDAEVQKATAAWKERLAELEKQLAEAWAEQGRIQRTSGATATIAAPPPRAADAWAAGGPGVLPAAPPPSQAPGDAWGGIVGTGGAGPTSANFWAAPATGPSTSAPADFGAGGAGGDGAAAAAGWGAEGGGSFEVGKKDKRDKKPKKEERRESTSREPSGGGLAEAPQFDARFGGTPAFGATKAFSFAPESGFGAGAGAFGVDDDPRGKGLDPADVAQLVGMGFSEDKVQKVLVEVSGNVDEAVSRLLGMSSSPAAAVELEPPRSKSGSGARKRSTSRRSERPTGDQGSMEVDPAALAEIMAMGFPEFKARQALEKSGGDTDAALGILLRGIDVDSV